MLGIPNESNELCSERMNLRNISPIKKSNTQIHRRDLWIHFGMLTAPSHQQRGGGSLRIHIWRQAILGTCPTASPQEAPSHPDESVVDVDTLRYIDEVFSNPLSRTHSLLKRGPNKLPLLGPKYAESHPVVLDSQKEHCHDVLSKRFPYFQSLLP